MTGVINIDDLSSSSSLIELVDVDTVFAPDVLGGVRKPNPMMANCKGKEETAILGP